MDFADYFWLAVVGLIAVGDVVMWAFFRKREWTFTEHVRKWFGIGKPGHEDFAGARWAILTGLLVAVTLHFVANYGVEYILIFTVGAAWSIWYHYAREAPRE